MIRGVILFAAVTATYTGVNAQSLVRDQFNGSTLSSIWTQTDGNSSAYSIGGSQLSINSTLSGTVEGVWRNISFETPFHAPDSFVLAAGFTYNRSEYKLFDLFLRNSVDSPIVVFRIWDSPSKWILVNKGFTNPTCRTEFATGYEPHNIMISRSSGIVSVSWDGVVQWQCAATDTVRKIEFRVADYTGGNPMLPFLLDSIYASAGGPDVWISSTHYPTIQAAIDAAVPNDTVNVGKGTAYEHLTIEKPLTLLSQFGADSTTIDGQNLIQDTSNSVITIVDAESVNIGGFKIRGGRGMMAGDSTNIRGGGLFVSRTRLTLEYSRIDSCILGNVPNEPPGAFSLGGAGLYADNLSHLSIYGCVLRGNQVYGKIYPDFTLGGGGVLSLADSTIVLNSRFVRNSCNDGANSLRGGAVSILGDDAQVLECVFDSNSIYWSHDSSAGGALNVIGRRASVNQNVFESNTTGFVDMFDLTLGGGCHIIGDSAVVTHNVFLQNRAGQMNAFFGSGGGLHCDGDAIRVDSNLFKMNAIEVGGGVGGATGGGACLRGSGSCVGNVAVGNLCSSSGGGHTGGVATSEGGGIFILGAFTVSHNVLFDNTCFGSECGVYSGIVTCNGGGMAVKGLSTVNSNVLNSNTMSGQSCFENIVLNGSGLYLDPDVTVTNCDAYGNSPNDAYGNNWSPGTNGNISADPQFCFPDTGNFYLKASSPCAAGNHVSGQTVGAFDVGCYGADMVKSLGLADGGSIGNVVSQMPKYGWKAYYHPSYTQAKFEIAVGTDNDWQYSEMWNPAPFNSSDTFVTYAGAPLVDGQTYYLRLRISDGVSWSNWYYTSFHMNTPPNAPVPYAPQWPNITVSTTPDLGVVNATDAENDTLAYDFEIYYDSMLTQLAVASPHVAETHNPDSTSWTVAPPLTDNKYYYWRARAYDGFEYSPWSSMRYFIADNANEPPNPFTLIDPPDSTGSILYNRKPTFRWTYTGDPDPYNQVRYKLELAVDPAFTFKQVIDSLYTSFWIPPDSLPYHSHHWWRVTATDQYGATTLSPTVKEFWVWTLGDVDHSNNVDIADLSRLIDYLYISFGPIVPRKVGDLDGDCTVDIADLSRMIDYLYLSLIPLDIGGCGP